MHDPIVNPGGRPMTGQLQRALDGITGRQRALVIRAFTETADSSPIAPLYRALVTELQLSALREADTERQFREMTQASIPDPPFPPATGPAMQYDPETGEFTELPDESDRDLP